MTQARAEQLLSDGEQFDLILVNRVFDTDGGNGIDMIRSWAEKKSAGETPIMLVSNYEDAQQSAIAAGAVPGFGKGSLGTETMLDLLRPHLA